MLLSLVVTVSLALATRVTDTANTRAPGDTTDPADPHLLFGGGVGVLSYPDGYRERLAMLGVRVRVVPGLALSVHPGFASATGVTSTTTSAGGGTRRRRGRTGGATRRSGSVSGRTDLPVSLDAEHAFDALPWAPSVSAGYGVLLPTGSASTGIGAGEVGGAFDVGLGVTPVEHFSVEVGAGRYRSGTAWALGRGGGSWGSAGASVEVARPLTLSLGLSGDLGTTTRADQATVTSGRTIDGSATLHLHVLPPFTLDAHHAYAGTAPRWSVGLEIGGVGLPLTTLGRLGR